MKTKKLLSLLLALMMMLSVVPMYASAAEALSASNVTEWPTVTYNNGEAMYFGQSVKDAVTLNGGTVTYNGTEVPGHFEFIDINETPTLVGTQRSNIKFVPDNTDEYTGFESTRNRNVTYVVSDTTPVFVDEANDPVVATEVEAGATLSTSTLSGGKVTNPYNANEPKLLAASWAWLNSYTVVQESGYYEAILTASGYNQLRAQVYVRIAGEIPETTIAEAPTVDTQTYDGVTTWGDVELKGGKAVLKIEGTEVAGTFAVTEFWKTRTVNPGSYEIDVVFTPADTEAALPYSLKIPVTVNKAPIKFVDENDNEVVPEITVPYGTKLTDGNMRYYISQAGCTAVAGNDGCYYGATDADGYIFGTSASGEAPEVGTHYYEFIARPYTTVGVTSNYAETVLKLKVTVTPVEAEMKLDTTPIKGTDGLELWVWNKDTSSAARPEGTFTVYLDGAVYKDNVKYGEHFTWQPAESKTYEFKATYTPTENDPFTIADFTLTRDIKLTRKLTLSDNIIGKPGDYKYGTAIEISANLTAENFAGWKITDAKGNEVDLGVDLTQVKISFTMPDYDIHVEALEKGAIGGDNSTGGIFDGLGDLTQGDSDNPIVNIFNNIIAWFKNIINTIIELFRSIGNNS